MENKNMEDTIYAPVKLRKKRWRIKNKKRFVLCIVLAVLLLLVAAAGAAYWYIKSKIPNGGEDVGIFNMFSQSVPENTNILVMGVDKDGYRSDFMMVVNYDPTTKMVNAMQIPRDTYVPGNGRRDKKINSAYFSGFEQSQYEVNLALGIEVQKYVTVDTEGFRRLVDAIGGVDFEVPFDMDYEDPTQDLYIHLEQGYQHLDGDKAEQFVRWRKNEDGTGGYAEGDLGRMDAQKEFLLKVADKALQLKNVLKIPEFLDILSENVETNLTLGEMMAYGNEMMNNLSLENIQFHVLPGESQYFNSLWYFLPDEEETKAIVDQYFYGTHTKPAKPASTEETPDVEIPMQEDEPLDEEPTPIRRTPKPTDEELSRETEKPEIPTRTELPEETVEPEEPVETKEPVATEKPVETEKPNRTNPPVETERPPVTTPVTTEEPDPDPGQVREPVQEQPQAA